MATVLEFRYPAQTRAYARSNRNGRTTSAEIVLFPGVRYERWEEASQEMKPKRKPKKRDKLELRD
jgi:hypothetical protein